MIHAFFSRRPAAVSRRHGGRAAAAWFLTAVLLCAACGILDLYVPDSLSVRDSADVIGSLPGIAVEPVRGYVGTSWGEARPAAATVTDTDAPAGGAHVKHYTADALLFHALPLKEVQVNVYDRALLCPGGMAFGVRLYTRGVIVVGFSDVTDADGASCNPASQAGIRVRDIIVSVNGTEADSAGTVTAAFENSGGQPVTVRVMRGDSECSFSVKPVLCGSDNRYKAGIWIRDNTAGIGTVTYVDPESGAFAGLGHGICDVDTGALMPLRSGIVSDVTVTGITPGARGCPGELKGVFGATRYGELLSNTPTGVYGSLSLMPNGLGEAIPIALRDEVTEGDAILLCALDSGTVTPYTVTIEHFTGSGDTKNFVLRVTDERLLAATGGIVQGMSGSPLIQNGRLIGAVTHVLINDPTRGYGIFIENMLKNAPAV